MSWDGSRLYSWREKARNGDTTARRLVQELRVQADHLLDMQPLSVMDKAATPVSGNKHDYMSQAPYFWYDSSKPNGLPYIRRDGERNPETYKITDHANLGELGSAALLLEMSPSWPSADAKALRAWYTEYLHWMLTSRNGRDEHAAANNHGTWYLVQATDFALFTADTSAARQLALQAFFTLARLARHAGVDLWTYSNTHDGNIRAALDWLLPYAIGKKKWDYQQIGSYNKDEFYGLLLQASPVYADDSYLSAARLIHAGRGSTMTELSWGK